MLSYRSFLTERSDDASIKRSIRNYQSAQSHHTYDYQGPISHASHSNVNNVAVAKNAGKNTGHPTAKKAYEHIRSAIRTAPKKQSDTVLYHGTSTDLKTDKTAVKNHETGETHVRTNRFMSTSDDVDVSRKFIGGSKPREKDAVHHVYHIKVGAGSRTYPVNTGGKLDYEKEHLVADGAHIAIAAKPKKTEKYEFHNGGKKTSTIHHWDARLVHDGVSK